jgi:hypothetical protein
MCHLERWETIESSANETHTIINTSYILIAIMTTLCITSRNDFLVYNVELKKIEKWDSTAIIRMYWCAPEKPIENILELYKLRLEFFDRQRWLYDDARLIPRDTHNPSSNSKDLQTPNFQQASLMWTLRKGVRANWLTVDLINSSAETPNSAAITAAIAAEEENRLQILTRSQRLIDNNEAKKKEQAAKSKAAADLKAAKTAERLQTKKKNDLLKQLEMNKSSRTRSSIVNVGGSKSNDFLFSNLVSNDSSNNSKQQNNNSNNKHNFRNSSELLKDTSESEKISNSYFNKNRSISRDRRRQRSESERRRKDKERSDSRERFERRRREKSEDRRKEYEAKKKLLDLEMNAQEDRRRQSERDRERSLDRRLKMESEINHQRKISEESQREQARKNAEDRREQARLDAEERLAIRKREEEERDYERVRREKMERRKFDADDREEQLRLLERKEDRAMNMDAIIYNRSREKAAWYEKEKESDHQRSRETFYDTKQFELSERKKKNFYN